ncbi:helix-turn-helix domain-containing protein [Aquimonas sp.]|uniref:helix-turn-helix domain-containing protein n=1 Tax=Aquimonas sp. TaxID=1872588 RepID=UPI0037C05726
MPAGTPGCESKSLGQRLRQRREALGLGVAELAVQLKLRAHIIESIERDALDELGAGVFTKGYLTAYARAVGLPLVAVAASPAVQPESPALMTHTVPRYRSMVGRYTSKLGHVFLTAAIVVPSIWLATSDQLPSQRATLTSLDVPPPQDLESGATGTSTSSGSAMADPPDVAVMASLTPMFPARSQIAPAPAPLGPPEPVAAADAAAGAAMMGLEMRLNADSWVEIHDATGRVLESSLLRAGTQRRLELGGGLRVSLGNADGVELRLNGEAIDVSEFRRANVARFRLAADGALTSPVPG